MSLRMAFLLVVACAVAMRVDEPKTVAADAETGLAEVQARFQLGAEFFVNRSETQESIRQHFGLMKEHGLTLARVFFIWDDIERTPGQWDFHAYDWVYDAAAANGIKIIATLCAEDPPGWVALTPFYHSRTDLNDPARRQHAAAYIEQVVCRYRGHAAHGYWLLMNEPGLPEYFSPPMLARFGQWLEKKYGSVEELNKRWFRPIRSFTELPAGAVWGDSGWSDYVAYLDWKEFNIQNLCDQLDWIGHEVKKHDPSHPTHINPAGLLSNLAPLGRDFWKEAKTADFVGASIHPAWHFEDFQRDQFGFAFGCTLDVLHSISKTRPWWITELQGGPTIHTGGISMNPTPRQYARWLWDSLGAGAKGAVFWSWHPRTLGREAGEWGLIAMDGTPSDRLAAVREFAETVRRHPALDRAVPQPAKAAILYSRPTLLVNDLEGRRKDSLLSLWGCHRALQASHVAVDFLDVDEVEADKAFAYDALYLPHCYAIGPQTAAALRRYVEQGGTLWADGLVGWKNEQGEVAARVPGELTDVFGIQFHDIQPIDRAFPVSAAGKDQAGQSWRMRVTLLGANVVARDADEAPMVTENRFGKGKAVYVATALSLGYFQRADALAREWIASPIVQTNSSQAVAVVSASERVLFRAMTASGKPIAILTNWGDDDDLTIRFQGSFPRIVNILSGENVGTRSENNNTLATFRLPKESVAVLIAE